LILKFIFKIPSQLNPVKGIKRIKVILQ